MIRKTLTRMMVHHAKIIRPSLNYLRMKQAKFMKNKSGVLLSALLSVCFLLFGGGSLWAQQLMTVNGTVVDGTGNPVAGATVVVEGTTNGTISDASGNFTLSEVPSNATLQFRFIGFETQEVAVDGRSTINVSMVDETTLLGELVVVGYGVQKKSDVTGAMVSVGSDEINERPVANAFEALQGRAAGVDITSNERPGEIGRITIRGVRSLTASSSPLYVVDGIPLMSSSSIETINPRDIESIDILKDASATAIYGSRGANGVIIISTNRGKEGKLSLNYSGTVTFENIEDKAPMMNASEYITWRRWCAYNAGLSEVPGDQPTQVNDNSIFDSVDATTLANINKGWAGGSWDGSRVSSTDWTDFVTQTGVTHEHTLSASGGTDKLQAYGSFGYINQEGTQIGQTYDRYTSKISVDIQPVDWFRMGGSINASWSEQDYGMSTLGASTSSWPNSIYDAAKRLYAYALPYDEEGEMILMPGGDDNVYTIIDEWNKSTQQRQMLRAMGSFYSELDFGSIFMPLKGLKYRLNFGPDFRHWREGVYIDKSSVNRLGGTSFARLRNQRDFSWTIDNMITYNKEVGRHNVGVTLLQTASSWNIESSSMEGQNIAKPSFLWNAFGSLDVASTDTRVGIGSDLTERQLTSYMGRVNYAFDNKYLLTVSGRWDGASQLSEGHKWTFFPSAALGWRMDQEAFMQNASWVDQLKLRLGFGSTGNSSVSPYGTLGAIQSFFVPFGGSGNTQAYATNEPNYTRDQIAMPNKELGWEITTQYNFGIDFSFMHGRVGGTIDLYKSKTEDLIMRMNIPIVTGYPFTYANVGETKNQGIDISLNTVNVKTNDFEWTSNINAAWQKDEIELLAYGKNDMIDNTWFIGESISVIYGIEGDGLWQASEEAEMAKFNENGHKFKAGMAKPVDQNDDYVIDAEDRVIIGNRNPRWTVGLTNTFNYKGVELSCMIYGRLGYQVATGGEQQLGRYNQRKIDYWTPDNTNADYQMPIYNQAGGDPYAGVLGYRSGSFLKIRNISLGYNFPNSLTSKLGIGSLKVYAQAKNPGMLYSKIDWLDMDLGGSTYNRGFVFGLNVGF